MPLFERYIGIDYSGAETAESSCKGLRVYVADGSGTPEQILLPKPPQQFWTRRGLSEWLCEELGADMPTIVGIDHGFSFAIAYFDRHNLPRDWPSFLLDFQKHWPTHERNAYIDFIRAFGRLYLAVQFLFEPISHSLQISSGVARRRRSTIQTQSISTGRRPQIARSVTLFSRFPALK
jgi:hypothetical protein